jgi:hypothetical protein
MAVKRGRCLSISAGAPNRYGQRKVSTGNNTDLVNAWILAGALRVDGYSWKALAKEDPCGGQALQR